jgi:NodT family efflux transporter outer membrane factor (OMF) lipoprotein
MARQLISAVSVTLAGLGGCATGTTPYAPPELSDRQAGWAVENSAVLLPGAVEDGDWWTDFDDPTLERLIAAGQAGNFDLAEARAGIAAAEAALAQAQAAGRPLGDVNASVTRQLQSEAATDFGGFPVAFEAQTNYSVGGQASWEIDLFGRISSSVERAEAALGGRAALVADIARLTTAQIATSYVSLRELDARLALNAASLARQEDILDLTIQLEELGEVAELDVVRQRNLVENTRAGLSALRAARAETAAALALLTGRTVPEFEADFPALAPSGTAQSPLSAAGPVRIGTPLEMLRRRPDIRVAERELAASLAGVDVARADLYPTLSLTGGVSLSALEIGDVPTDEALGYSFGPRISWGVFNLPLTRARIDQAEAEADAAAVRFEKAVVSALTETDNALARYNEAVEEAVIRGRALADARRALELVEVRYREGADSLIALIDTQRQALAAEDAEAQARHEALRRRIAVFRALGG